ncbi:DUF4116 domain-containing protein [Saccharibacillus sp. JS10]|uniref:DUF4116 domain-containing protein n=1 Tax=Saccharibacillus sp. JS10 TaxID=2950552 RepID=UPI00210E9B7B|nr:DUF4116 domain-containing protein [Saccharibacillus sp. JS10]MCQ4085523.1 DUF4116 domain-containing protein [Saccharibacillus sp. JS10]
MKKKRLEFDPLDVFEPISLGDTLSGIPKGELTLDLCMKVLKMNGFQIRFVPEHLRSEDIIIAAVSSTSTVLRFIDPELITLKVAQEAISNDPLSLRYIPHELRIPSLCNQAVKMDWGAFEYLPQRLITKKRCITFLKQRLEELETLNINKLRSVVRNCFPSKIRADQEIIELEWTLGVRYFKVKKFDASINKFIVVEPAVLDCFDIEVFPERIFSYKTFKSFLKKINNDLSRAELQDFHFDGINIRKLNIKDAYISTKTLQRFGLYDDSFYKLNVSDGKVQSLTHTQIIEQSSVNEKPRILPFTSDLHERESVMRRIHYISDIHLDHRLIKMFPTQATRREIHNFINKIVTEMLESTDLGYNDYLVVAGDVSSHFDIVHIFYELLSSKCKNVKIIAILGNHELWAVREQDNSLEGLIDEYRKLFDELGILFLHNDLLFLHDNDQFDYLSEEEILKSSIEELQKWSRMSSFIFWGGLGFSGLNDSFNATNGLYRNTILTRAKDQYYSQRFDAIHRKLIDALGAREVIICTHTPLSNWSSDTYHPSWIYMNGHTHRNLQRIDNTCTVYADNQIGYYGKTVFLKWFDLRWQYDFFCEYPEGIHLISQKEYRQFAIGLRIQMQFTRKGKIYMLKKKDLYCFIFENDKKIRYFLSGGKIKKIEEQNLNYYYDHMDKYAKAIKIALSGYHEQLLMLSKFIKNIGGSGIIHGSIVDIDVYNHIYLDAQTRNIVSYWAEDITSRYIATDIPTLLSEKRPDLYKNYKKLIKNSSSKMEVVEFKQSKTGKLESGTEMYKGSNQMRSLQYLLDHNIIREWNESVVDKILQGSSVPLSLLNDIKSD